MLLDHVVLIIHYLKKIGWGGLRGVIRVSLFEASNSVVSRGLSQSDGKMNQAVGEKNCLNNYGGKKWLVHIFIR